MDENELRNQWANSQASYQAWGERLTAEILLALESRGITDLIKIPPLPRVKTGDSLIEKVFYRNPGKYSDPWAEIEDFVGTRFVVLLERDIRIVQDAIEQLEDVESSISRDHKEIERAHPNSFDYASTHLICRPRNEIKSDGAIIAPGIPCEVQIRTLLQHSWSEVSHSTLYKSAFEASDKMKRSAAKSSALIEATSDYFDSVYDEISRKEDAMDVLTKQLTPIYKSHVKQDPSVSGIEQQVLDSYAPLVSATESNDLAVSINDLLSSKGFIADRILARRAKYLVYKQPSILLIYWLVSNQPKRMASHDWGLPHHILSEIYTDLGKHL